MKTSLPFSPSFHIRGYHPLRELTPENDAEEMAEPCFAVQIPCGFETLDIAVYGDGLRESDAIEAAYEFLVKREWCSAETETDCWQCGKISNGKFRMSILPVTHSMIQAGF